MDRTQSENTAYRNAMAGTVSVYGAVPEGEKRPQRLHTHYVSNMPEEHAATFKGKFEEELSAAEAQLAPDTVKVLICDGARSIWKYAHKSGRFDGYEKLVDYWHTLEHLSLAAEALCIFRARPPRDSSTSRPVIPIHRGHPFQTRAAAVSKRGHSF
jgi:hypothetical protein